MSAPSGARRVVVTGMGVVSALGLDAPAHWAALKAGVCGIGPLELRDLDRLSAKVGAQAKGFVGEDRFDRSQLALYDRHTQFALTAAAEAWAQADPGLSEEEALRAAVVIGTALPGMQTFDDSYRAVFEEGRSRVHPFVVPRLMVSAPASHISMAHGLKGPTFSVSTACASANHAIGQAFHLVRSGAAELAVAGGAEAPLTFGAMKAWEGLRVMTRDVCRPFSKGRAGMAIGEGAGVFVLESRDRAEARGATILAEIAGFGMSADAGDIVQPSADGAARAIRAALADGGLAPEEIVYVNAHGTGTAANDRTETAALRAVFGGQADALSVSSTKSMHGHALGAAGALEFAAVLGALGEGVIPPTVNYEAPDPECDLDVTPNAARTREVPAAISNAFAFGGLNAVLALRRG
ncbi:beta-ketoacyl-[acyl-carrier-protein] synthase family protein [Albimonas pacifica]|uniref:Nodulation protein E n=1 Tax=Albimonas pacifica TaxID=1114924 RepID=A0A1I3K9L5_9RHOB|nr:beta-ketoacyl-[acyl-carrier-protein] synthase family protein [Albimonas pacifica]SFI69182.1 nodulation protein E [Albimonas pacifica]